MAIANRITPDNDNQDSRLHCLGCDYNLTGVESNRCPECGEEFDRAQLIAIRDGNGEPQPIPIWDDRDQIGIVRAYVQTVLSIWFQPRRFVKTFPLYHDTRSSIRFIVANSMIALGLAATSGLIDGFYSRRAITPLLMIIIASAQLLISMTFAEVFAEYLANMDMNLKGVRERSNRWRGILRFWTCNIVLIIPCLQISYTGLTTPSWRPLDWALPVLLMVCWMHLLLVVQLVGSRKYFLLLDIVVVAPMFFLVTCIFVGPIVLGFVYLVASFLSHLW